MAVFLFTPSVIAVIRLEDKTGEITAYRICLNDYHTMTLSPHEKS
jgi:hypothetical protein